MKISTKKIKAIGTGFLMANIMTGIFAAPTNVFSTINAEDYYNLPQVSMTGGSDEQKNSIPTIQLSGGQAQDTYTLQPTQFTGGQDEIISQIPQMVMGSGVQGVQYEDFEFTQTSLGGGVMDQYSTLDLEVISNGVDELKTDFNSGNDIEMIDGTDATPATSDGNLQAPTDIDFTFPIDYSIDGVSNFLGTYNDIDELLSEFDILANPNYNLMLHSTDLFIAMMDTPGVLAQDIIIPIVIDYTDTSGTPKTFSDTVTITGGQDEVLSHTTVSIIEGFSEFGEDRTLTIGAANSVFVSDASKVEQTTSEIATRITSELQIAYPTYSITTSGSDIIFESDSVSDVTIPVSGSDYSTVTAKAQKLSITVNGDLVANAQDDLIQIDEEIFNLGSSILTSSSILTLLESEEYSTFEDDINNGKLLLTAREKGDRSGMTSPIVNHDFSSVNGVKASTSFTVTESVSANPIDNTIEVLGQTVTLTAGDSPTDIATDIATALSGHLTYDVTSSGATVNIVAKNYGVDTTDIFGTDNNYSTVDEVLGKSNSVTIPAGIQMGSVADQVVTINGFDLTIPNTVDLTAAQVATELASQYNSADTSLTGYTASVNGDDLTLTQKVGTDDTTTTFVTDGDFNTQDKKSATLTITIPNTESLPNNPDESSLTIDGNTFDLTSSQDYIDNGVLTVDEIGSFIAGQTFTSYTSVYDESSNQLTFTTELEDEDANSLNLATNADLAYVTENNMWASSTITISAPYSGTSTDSLVSTDSIIIIGGVTIDLGTANLDETGITTAIKTALDNDGSFSSMYTVTTNAATLNIEKQTPEFDNSILNNGGSQDNDYTTVNEIKSSGSLLITQPIVDGAADKNVIIAGETINFANAGEDISSMAQTIVDELNTIGNLNSNTRAALSSTPGEIVFDSKLTGISGDIDLVTELQYNGKAQSSTLTMSNQQAGYTYELSINGNTYSDIVTPQNPVENIYQMLLDEIQLDSTLTSSLAGNVIAVQGPIEHSFDFTLTGEANSAPVANNVMVSDLDLANNIYTCNYDYLDENVQDDLSITSDEENYGLTVDNTKTMTTFTWSNEDGPISGATEKTLDLDNFSNLEDTMIECSVTPAAKTGVKIGQIQQSSNQVQTPLAILELTNGEMFSIPSGVDSVKMNSEANLVSGDNFVTYLDGAWDNIETDNLDNAIFKPLMGYKFTSSSDNTLILPIYVDDNYDFSTMKTTISSDFNLVGLNSIYSNTAGELLESLTQRSLVEQKVNTIFDDMGETLGSYTLVNNGEFEDTNGNIVLVDAMQAYWISVNGNEDTIFYGVSNPSEDPEVAINFPSNGNGNN